MQSAIRSITAIIRLTIPEVGLFTKPIAINARHQSLIAVGNNVFKFATRRNSLNLGIPKVVTQARTLCISKRLEHGFIDTEFGLQQLKCAVRLFAKRFAYSVQFLGAIPRTDSGGHYL